MSNKLLFFLVFLFISPLWSQPYSPFGDPTAKAGIKSLNLKPDDLRFQKGRYDLTDYLYVLVDPDGELSYFESSSSEYADSYVPFSEVSLKDLSMNRHAYWLRLSIKSDLAQEVTWVTNFMEAEVEAFTMTKTGDIEQKRSGILVPASDQYFRKHYSGLGILPISLPADSSDTYYWRIQTQPVFPEVEHGLNLNFTLMSHSYLSNWRQVDGFVHALFVGFFIAVGLYHLVIFFYCKQLNYLWFFFYCVTGPLAISILFGYDLNYFLAEKPFVHYFRLQGLVFYGWYLFFLVFSKSFLQMSKLAPAWEKVLWIIFGLTVVFGVWSKLIIWTDPSLGLTLRRITQALGMTLPILLLLISYIVIRKGYQPAKFYLLASVAYLIGIIISGLVRAFHVLPEIDHVNWLTIGMWVQLCVFAYGLTHLFRQYELQRHLSQAEAIRLQELNAVKSRLYTNITHEFRTPLTVIIGMTHHIKEDTNVRDIIRRNGKKLLYLINQLLDLSKFDHGAMTLKARQADIIGYLNYLTESFHSMAKEKDIRLTFYSEEPDLLMDFDEVRLQHVVYNLFSNAIKYTGRGGKVVLHTRKMEANGQFQLQMKVQDTGIGISKENLPHIFDRFYQVDSSPIWAGEGTGIGLALAKEYVELMGGAISVSSEPGKGSEFTVLLPITNRAPVVPVSDLQKENSTDALEALAVPQWDIEFEPPVDNGGGNGDMPILLIVEDNRDVTVYIRSIVQNHYRVFAVPNGRAGLEKAIELVPDIIISDVMMPEMDGYALTKILKNDARTSHIPIVLLTAKAEQQDRITGLQQGADAYLVKPFNKTEFLVRLDQLTALRQKLQRHYTGLEAIPADKCPANQEEAFLQKIIQVVEDNLDDAAFSTSQLYQALQMSQSQFYRKLMALTGKSPSVYMRTIRLRKAAHLLKTTDLNISEIAWQTGFNDPNYFSRVFQQEYGQTPRYWRR